MGRKDKSYKDVDLALNEPEQLAATEEETLLESEAYAEPEIDKGMETTVMKPVGKGGPVPIIAPKGNTVQLQPIVVPLAVVPYMTQDSGILRTDGAGAYQSAAREYAEAESYSSPVFESVASEKKKKRGVKPRIFAAVVFLLSALAIVPYILAYFYNDFDGKIYLTGLNIINIIKAWAAGTAPVDIAIQLLHIICAGFAAITAVIALISLIIGKFPKLPLAMTSLLSAAPVVGLLIYKLVKHSFDIRYDALFIAVIALAVLSFILTVIFSLVLNVDEDKKEKANDSVI